MHGLWDEVHGLWDEVLVPSFLLQKNTGKHRCFSHSVVDLERIISCQVNCVALSNRKVEADIGSLNHGEWHVFPRCFFSKFVGYLLW